MGRTEQLVFGLDIGTRSVVGTVGYKKNAGDFTVVAQVVREHETRAMIDGQIHDIGKVAETIKDVKRSLEKKLDGNKLSEVCIAAAGRVLKTITVHVDEVFSESVTVDEEAVRALELKGVEKAYTEIKKNLVSDEENYYCVAYTVVRYYLNDFQMGNLTDHKADRIGADILATFLPDEVIEGLYTTVDKAGLKVANLTLEPIAAMLVAVPERFRLLNIALVDVGAGTSDICITRDGSITAYGMIPMAGDCLTEVIANNHLVDFNTADEIKKDAGSKKRTIKYKDIMGLEQSVTPLSVRNECFPDGSERPVIRFPGITHVILETEMDRTEAERMAPVWCRALESEALGLMFLDRERGILKPLVYVPSADTLFWESSCASGTTAVGAYLAAESGKAVQVPLKQPGGTLEIDAAPDGTLFLKGSVRLVRQVSGAGPEA